MKKKKNQSLIELFIISVNTKVSEEVVKRHFKGSQKMFGNRWCRVSKGFIPK